MPQPVVLHFIKKQSHCFQNYKWMLAIFLCIFFYFRFFGAVAILHHANKLLLSDFCGNASNYIYQCTYIDSNMESIVWPDAHIDIYDVRL